MNWKGRHLSVEILFSQGGLATQVLVRVGDSAILFDAGDGTLRDLLQAGVSPHVLAGVFFTHGHADHVSGLYGLLGYLRAEDHRKPFCVWYPETCCEVEAILGAFRACHDESIPYALESKVLSDGETVRLEEVQVLARKVEHWNSVGGRLLSPAPALGYRLSSHGEVVAISGDTAPCSALVDLVKDADLALVEATLDETASAEQRTHLHLTATAARAVAGLARRAWFIHRPPNGQGLRAFDAGAECQ
ncbi:ribonuclease Z [Candidatus Bipolaricaulota bacterium]|nr:ribonuclease Z [Candidatus Bipolaricaulota bacterium]